MESKEPTHETEDVRVEEGFALVESNGADSVRYIAANPRQRQEVFPARRHRSAVAFHESPAKVWDPCVAMSEAQGPKQP